MTSKAAAAAKQKPQADDETKFATAAEMIDALAYLEIRGADLRRLVELTQRKVGVDLNQRAQALKNSRDGAGQPYDALRYELVKQHRCACNAALAWTAND